MITRVGLFLLGAVVAGTLVAAGQRQPPPQTVGQTEEALRTLDLTNEIESGKGRPLRMADIEPFIALKPDQVGFQGRGGR